MASPYPSLEVAIVNIKGQNVEDESTREGQMWHEIFKNVAKVPGFIRVGWGRNIRDRDINLFCVDWESYKHHNDFMDAQGVFTPPLMDLINGPFNMYHIRPNTEARAAFYAPYSAVVYFWALTKRNSPS